MDDNSAQQPARDKGLAGKLALVTGASRGIGAATAIELGRRGAHVILTARDDRKLEQVEDTIHAAGGTATIAPMDLAEPDSIARLATAIGGRWDALDILVINAAVFVPLTPVQDIDPRAFSRALTVNVAATQNLLAAFHPMLKRAEAGRVIGVTSSVGASPRAYWAAYASTKAAFDNLLLSYALENANTTAIRAAVVNPGGTRTEMRARAFPGEDPATVQPPENVATFMANMIGEPFPNGEIISVKDAR
ncbi:SDR family NAD(P)-dependent oxidoreductase [Croceicoccus sp. BE223]|uniref:SDR family NAD(P)-dependent oxidoreductase n=1 Tax=Croceicoccus sp. BE223 TaxID=2817716 RepID=UPI00285E4EFD|nr:SDR family NAD(P)-dependent oxidoreductase [Croceicoccus sp. BE223]MDR7102567.1 NAD(P)-dependent dehydrogenase (short-subunit alcohol dehydrogenase family) [Croceicoccus sp. BE223]